MTDVSKVVPPCRWLRGTSRFWSSLPIPPSHRRVAAIVPGSQVAKCSLCACAGYYMQRTKSPRAKRGSFEKEFHS